MIINVQMLMKALRDRQLTDEMKQSGQHPPDGASSAVEKQIKHGLAQAEQLLNQDTLT